MNLDPPEPPKDFFSSASGTTGQRQHPWKLRRRSKKLWDPSKKQLSARSQKKHKKYSALDFNLTFYSCFSGSSLYNFPFSYSLAGFL